MTVARADRVPGAPAATVATALAGAYLAGDWEPAAMRRRAQRALGDRSRWLDRLTHAVALAYPQRPGDRPRELAAFLAASEDLRRAAANRRRPLRVRVWMAAPTEMAPTRWPVPPLPDLAALARWLGVDGGHLDWFADRRSLERSATDERLRHHHRRWLPKPDGSFRLLEAPKYELKDLQRQVLHGILDHIGVHHAAHGFRPGRSARTGAAMHQGRAVVLRVDLESFFTSVHTGRVYGIFRRAGYPEPVAHALAGLCTTVTPPAVLRAAPGVPDALLDQRRRLLQRLRSPHLAQGAPTSPALANLCAHGLDRRLAGLAATLGATYTRYADDLVLSGDRPLVRAASTVVRLVETIAAEEGFRVHPLKTRVQVASRRQTVTGLVVNHHANLARPDYDRLRAILHNAAVHGPAAANRDGHPDFRSHLQGRIGWAGAGNDARTAKLARAFAAIDW